MRLACSLIVCLLLMACGSREESQTSLDVGNRLDSISGESTPVLDSLTGLVVAPNFELVQSQCTACHSAKLVTQSSATREGWEQMIRWMQKDQGLWDLGANEGPILDYLAQHYGVKKKGRRAPLTEIDWYVLDP